MRDRRADGLSISGLVCHHLAVNRALLPSVCVSWITSPEWFSSIRVSNAPARPRFGIRLPAGCFPGAYRRSVAHFFSIGHGSVGPALLVTGSVIDAQSGQGSTVLDPSQRFGYSQLRRTCHTAHMRPWNFPCRTMTYDD